MKVSTYIIILLMILTISSCSNGGNEWSDLFNGKDLTGWIATENTGSFRVEEGALVCSGKRGHLFYNTDVPFKNFEMIAEIKTLPLANSGIYFHTSYQEEGWPEAGYEVQVNNSHIGADNYRETKKTGSLYAVRNIHYQMVRDGEWFTMRIKVLENHVEIFVNDIKVVDYIQPDNPWRSDEHKGRLLGSGTFALQAHDENSTVYFKSIRVRRLPGAEKSPLAVEEEWETTLAKLMDKGFPLVDYHVHLKGGLTLEEVKENSLKLGINYGLAPNCGLKFPVTDDASLAAYMDTVRGQPIFRGMQAEGREWITLFSPGAIAKFDYVFTDVMTFTDSKGRRNRIWIKDEVWIDDKQQFMEQLVGKIEAIFSQEPVDIYVNPTVLPDALMPEHKQLWTNERMARVVKVLADNNIALEINARYKTPSSEMIKMAKASGIKFTFGTNNTGRELGRLEYCLQMIEECGLTPDDIFMPKPQEEKPVLVKGLPSKITG
ncbi:MAG TPA: family 16 glycoside hydrolase [Bacteroidales bacterium]|nr:family 16 glycoside hydrolase [Bacteroidales bacterium]